MSWLRLLLVALTCVLVPTLTVDAADNAWSTEAFMNRKTDWDQMIGATIRIEGRVSLSGGGQLRLSKCEVPVHVSDASIRSLQGKKAVEITGRLVKENGKLFLDADRIQVIQTDLEQYESRFAKLRNPKAAEWYALGDWASERSRFYDDAELLKKARTAYDRGITVEWRAMDADDATARFQLADKVSQYKLADARRLELIHEGNRILWSQAAKSDDRQLWVKLASKLAQDYPACTQPMAAFPEDLKERYEKEPLLVYRDSPPDVRQQLQRLFYTSVLLKTILHDAAKDGSNAEMIVKRLEQQVPEAISLAGQYRELRMKWRLEQATTATRPEIELLAADFRARQQPDQAKLAVTRWLQAREPGSRQEGPAGLLQLAEEYLSLAQDERKAVTLLAEANKLDPMIIEVTDKLRSLGYANAGGTWIKSKGDSSDLTPLANSIESGSVAVGMSAAMARKFVNPNSLSRVFTKLGVAEVWACGAPGTSRVIIRLQGSDDANLRVIDIRNER